MVRTGQRQSLAPTGQRPSLAPTGNGTMPILNSNRTKNPSLVPIGQLPSSRSQRSSSRSSASPACRGLQIHRKGSALNIMECIEAATLQELEQVLVPNSKHWFTTPFLQRRCLSFPPKKVFGTLPHFLQRRCLSLNSKHWFTTSFLRGRCLSQTPSTGVPHPSSKEGACPKLQALVYYTSSKKGACPKLQALVYHPSSKEGAGKRGVDFRSVCLSKSE